MHRRVNEEHLLLSADAHHTFLEKTVIQHLLEGLEVAQHADSEEPQLVLIVFGADRVITHNYSRETDSSHRGGGG